MVLTSHQYRQMRIVYCTDSICYPGGIQRITVAKANALAEVDGNEVWIVVTDNKRTPVLPIADKVHLVDLDMNYFADDWKSKIHIVKGIFVKRKKHKRRLASLLNTILPDIVISTGTSEKNFTPCIKVRSNPVFVREIHSASNYRRLSAEGWFSRIAAWIGDFIDYRICIGRYDKIVVLTHEDKELHWAGNNKVVVMPNPLTIKHSLQASLANKTVITAGRLVAQKNFVSLIRVWTIAHQAHPDWRLEIWGDGKLKAELQQQIVKGQLTDSVRLMGYTSDIISKFADASIFVCTSLFEGFGLVITEAMSCGLPAVSYACPCGPRDIITDGKDGFLVKPNGEQALAERINRLIEDEPLRQQMGRAAKEKSMSYSIDAITRQWMTLFSELFSEKRLRLGTKQDKHIDDAL